MDRVEEKIAEAIAEAKENPSDETIVVIPREEVQIESPTPEDKPFDAGLSDSEAEVKAMGDAPVVISTLPEAEAADVALQDEAVGKVTPAQNPYPPEAPPVTATKPSEAGSEQRGEPARMSFTGDGEQPLPADMNVPVGRNWEAEWKELADAHPEVVGKELPQDIYEACLKSEQHPLRVYEAMMLTKQQDEIDMLRQQINTLKQNAEAASRAPVSAVSGGGAGAEPEDAFIAAFGRYR